MDRLQEDKLFNALAVGMSLADAYVYAELTGKQIADLEADETWQSGARSKQRAVEFELLSDMHSISKKGLVTGNSHATEWLLEKLFPRYANKAASDIGSITINVPSTASLKDIETVKHA